MPWKSWSFVCTVILFAMSWVQIWTCPQSATSAMNCTCVGIEVTCQIISALDHVPEFTYINTHDTGLLMQLTLTPGGTTSNGSIKQIQTKALFALLVQHVNIQHLGVQELQSNAFNTPHGVLTRIELQNNQISTLHSGIFLASPNVTYLDLSKNTIPSIHEEVFVGLHKLEHLYLQDNQIRSIHESAFADLVSLEFLYLSRNHITFLFNQLRPLISIRFLYLDANPDIAGRSLQLTPQSLNTSSMISSIDLSSCNLSIFPLSTFKGVSDNINTIIMSSNYITQLPDDAFQRLTKLKRLDLSFNQLEEVPSTALAPLEKLTTLSLNRNRITNIEENAFANASSGVRSLVTLDLSYNEIVWIDPAGFDGLSYLRSLRLGYNNLHTLPYGSIAFLQTLDTLELAGNIIRCDCHIEWLQNFVKSHYVDILGEIRCESPIGYTLLNFPLTDKPCTDPNADDEPEFDIPHGVTESTTTTSLITDTSSVTSLTYTTSVTSIAPTITTLSSVSSSKPLPTSSSPHLQPYTILMCISVSIYNILLHTSWRMTGLG